MISRSSGTLLLTLHAVVASVVAVLLGAPTGAQSLEVGQLAGAVRSAGDDPLPGTRITVTGAGLSRSALADSDGRFRFPALPEATYTVKAELAGFETEIQADIVLAAARTTNVDLVLQMRCLVEFESTAESPLPYVLRQADAVVHLRILDAGGTRRFTFGSGCLIGAEYVATSIRFVKRPRSGVDSSNTIRFVQVSEAPSLVALLLASLRRWHCCP